MSEPSPAARRLMTYAMLGASLSHPEHIWGEWAWRHGPAGDRSRGCGVCSAVETEPCPTCTWPSRETTGLVCETCGWDYAKGEKP